IEELIEVGCVKDAVGVTPFEVVVAEAYEVSQVAEFVFLKRQPDPEQERVEQEDAQDEKSRHQQEISERRFAVIDPNTSPVPGGCRVCPDRGPHSYAPRLASVRAARKSPSATSRPLRLRPPRRRCRRWRATWQTCRPR